MKFVPPVRSEKRLHSCSAQLERGFSLLELLLVLAIMGMLIALSLRAYQPALAKAMISEAMTASADARLRVQEHYATTGRWLKHPLATADTEDFDRARNESIEIEQGAVSVRFNPADSPRLQGDLLTFRPMTPIGGEGMGLYWLCGHAESQTESTAQPAGPNRTNIPPLNLIGLCRDQREWRIAASLQPDQPIQPRETR